MTEQPKVISNGRMRILPDTYPKAPRAASHISPEVREALSKQTPEKRQRVLDVADRK